MAENDEKRKEAIRQAVLEQAKSGKIRTDDTLLRLFDRKPDKDPPTRPDLILYSDEPLDFGECLLEISALNGLDEQVRLAIENIDYKTLAAHVAQLEALDPEFEAELKAARTARQAFGKAAKPPMPLPTVAPKLWADNTEGLPATAFVAKYYAPWIEAGVLTLKAIGQCDPALSKAYSNRAHRNPSEALPLAKAEHPRFIADPQEAAERYRENARRGNARYRAKRGALTHD